MFRIATWRERTRVWLCVSTDRPTRERGKTRLSPPRLIITSILSRIRTPLLCPLERTGFLRCFESLSIYIYSQAAPTSPPREHARVKTPSANSPKFDPASTFAIEEFRRERTTRRMIAIHPSFSLQGEEEAQASCLVSQLRLGGHDNKVTTRPLLQDAPHYRA